MSFVGRARFLAQHGGDGDLTGARGARGMFAACAARRSEPPDEHTGAQTGAPRGQGQVVMVVDDDEALLELTTRALLELGYEPVGFGSAGTALESFLTRPDDFVALLTDLRMPGMAGDVLIRAVRIVRPLLPVILISGDVQNSCSNDLADEVLAKPLVVSALAASLARLLRIA